jgi:hypothetical protein
MGNAFLPIIFRPFNNFILRPIYRLARFISQLLFPKPKPDQEIQNPVAIPVPEANSSDEEEANIDMNP